MAKGRNEPAPAASRGPDPVPKIALLLSLGSLWVPVFSSSVFPEWTHGDLGILVWLLALIPAFLLSLYRGWKGASLGLAGAMAAFSVAQVIVVYRAANPPSEEVMLGVVTVLIVVALGSGWISTLLRSSLKKVQSEAFTDPGTGLPNRRHTLLHLEKSFARSRRGKPLSVVLFDLDHFKQVNDRFGHQAGDEVLRDFADILATRTREMDLSARFGGEEFLTVLEECDLEGARLFADDVRKAVAEREWRYGRVTVSAGVAEHEEGMANPDVLVAAADQALYRAKEGGRNRVCWAGQQAPDALDAPDRERSPRSEGLPTGSGELILAVDDDQATLRGVSRGLRRYGYVVLEASSSDEALEIVEGLDAPPDLILTDVVLPPASGYELVESLAGLGVRVPVIYMSGYTRFEAESPAPSIDDRHAFLEKPFALEDLTTEVREILDAARTEVSDTAVEARSRADSSGRGDRIGVLAPDDARGLSVAHRLKLLGYDDVYRVSSSARLLQRSGEWPDLVVCDAGAAGAEDLDRLDAVRLRLEDRGFIPVLVLVEATNPDFLWRSSSWGTFDFLTEPYELPELGVRVGNLLRLRKEYSRERSLRKQLEARLRARSAELEGTRTEVLLRLARAAELRDDLTGLHAERVGILSALIARRLGEDPDFRGTLEQVAPLHDVGKVAIPDSILNKPGALTPAEREVMCSHTVVGARLLSGSRHPLLTHAESIARHHHERWDGTGYPDGLKGEDIPRAARIVAVADVFDSLTHARPYREANSREVAVNLIEEGRGTHFDPEVVDAFRDLVRTGELDEARDPSTVAAPDPRPVMPPELAEEWLRESAG